MGQKPSFLACFAVLLIACSSMASAWAVPRTGSHTIAFASFSQRQIIQRRAKAARPSARQLRRQPSMQKHARGKKNRALRKVSARSKKSRRPGVSAHRVRKAAAVRYAYPTDFFMWQVPTTPAARLPAPMRKSLLAAFNNGLAGTYTPDQLVASGAFVNYPLRGGIFRRREAVKWLILHSTETERLAAAKLVIKSWSRGLRHSGAQYVVDRDGTIYQAVNPDYGAVHVDIFRTLNGVNNDNAVGIEIVRSGKQKYTNKQLASVINLSAYLQSRYRIDEEHIVGHAQIQPSTRRDPIAFDWTDYRSKKSVLQAQAAAGRTRHSTLAAPVGLQNLVSALMPAWQLLNMRIGPDVTQWRN